MKRANVFLAAVVIVLQIASVVWASPTTANEAGRAVRGWLKAAAMPLGARLGERVGQVETFSDEAGRALYHIVYLEPGGFVIVSGDDEAEPIVGFVERGQYDPSAENPLGFLVTNDVKGRVEAIRDVAMSEERRAEGLTNQRRWGRLSELGESGGAGTDGVDTGELDEVRIAPIIESRWDQRTACSLWVYAYYTPNHWYCGCVATALAQIMRYYEYPTSGIGKTEFDIKIDGSVTQRDTRGGDGNGGAYDWDNMPLVPDCSITTAQQQAIGALCHDAGVGISDLRPDDDEYTHYDYSNNVTVAFTYSATLGLKQTFMYGNAVMGNNWPNSIPTTNRNKMINPNLDGGHPVYLGIRKSGTTIGHAIVCDGYGYDGGTLYHHLNMGWGGDDDAWYNLPTIDAGSGYDIVYETIYNIRPYGGGDGEMISGRVFDPCGVPLANPLLYAEPVGQSIWIPSSKSWDNGIYAFDNLESNTTYKVRPLVTGYVFTSQNAATGTSTQDTTTVGNVWGLDFYGAPLEITAITPNSGPKGSYICIEGENFGDSGGYVIFAGGGWGTEVEWSDTVIYCRVPGNAQTGEVQIATAESDLSFGMSFEVTSPNTVYVDDDAGLIENGSEEYPLSSIQMGIGAVATNGTVVVNPGTYYENIDFDGRAVMVTSSAPEDANVVALTVIDGNGLDVVVRFENAEDANSILTGLTIRSGYSEWDGGGIYCEHSSPSIRYCVITENYTDGYDGAGVRLFDRSCPQISYCTISENSVAESRNGAGIACINDCNAVISHCVFSDNVAGYGGAGIYVNTSTPVITDCLFSGNSLTDAYTYGGAVNIYNSSPVLTNCTFIGNSASWEGGGLYNSWDCCPTLIGCTFINNEAGESGGAMSNTSGAKPKLVNCSFLGNRAGARGGAVYSYGSNATLTMTNCKFVGNVVTKTGSDGGAVFNDGSGPTITNCTFSDNFAKDKGGAIYNAFNNYGSNGNAAAANCVLWGNTGSGQIYDYYSTTSVTYSDVEGGWTGTGNIDSDPVFIGGGRWVDVNDANEVVAADDANAVWVDGDYRLLYGSPCIDAGNNAAVPADTFDLDGDANSTEPVPYDLDGYARIFDGDCNTTQIVDMGAYEFDFGRLGDCDGDCEVDAVDYAVLANAWLAEAGEGGYDEELDIGIPQDGIIDGRDLAVMAEYWLAGK